MKTILITGVSKGIGQALSELFLAQGQQVIGVGRSAPASLLDRPNFHFYSADLLNVSTLPDLAKTIAQKHAVDMFVHNAMETPQHKLYLRYKADELLRAHTVATVAPLSFIQALTPGMRSRGYGRIVLLGSVVQMTGSKGQLVYLTAKSALEGMTKALALELASSGVTTNLLLLGPVETEKFKQNLSADNQAKLKAASPSGELVSYEQIYHTLNFLLAPESQAINGVSLPVAQGLHLSGSQL